MSETWRRKNYYKHRYLIPVADAVGQDTIGWIGCLSKGELSIIRTMLQYAHWRSTYADSMGTDYYIAPDNSQWDSIEAVLAALEDKLMGCSDLLDVFEEIAGNLACLCAAAYRGNRDGAALPAVVQTYLDDGGLLPGDDNGPTSPASDARCALAQLNYWLAWELLTEVIQPLQDALTDVLLPLAMVALAAMIGTPVLGIPAGAFLAWLWNLAEIWETGEMVNLQNTFRAYEDELICAVYQGLAINYAEASARAGTVIDAMADTSLLDKKMFAFLFQPWALKNCQTAWTAGTAWALANVEAGRCDDCDIIIGDDWYAVPVEYPLGDLFLDHSTPGAYWVSGDVCGAMRAGTVCAFIVEDVEQTGCTCEITQANDTCTGDDLMDEAGYDLADGDVTYVYKPFTHDYAQAISILSPGADPYNQLFARTGPGNWQVGFHLGWNCTGTVLLRIKYIVYEGTP